MGSGFLPPGGPTPCTCAVVKGMAKGGKDMGGMMQMMMQMMKTMGVELFTVHMRREPNGWWRRGGTRPVLAVRSGL